MAEGQIMKDVILLGTTTLKRMLSAVYDENDPLYERNTFSECGGACMDFRKNPCIGDRIVYLYYHHENNQTIMTTFEDDFVGCIGSSAGFEGKVMP